ncbi:MAG: hypothetical protein QXX94_08135 [Candidatus Bathyarchaeia archaeon]
MGQFTILYAFHEITQLSLNRLKRLKLMNPNLLVVPLFGIRQRICLPTLINLREARILNLTFLKFRIVYDLSKTINERVESLCMRREIEALQRLLQRMGLSLYCDYTPMGYYNLDLVILNWFSSIGKNIDFDFLIFFEHDMFATKSLESLYNKYVDYDAGFVNYGKPDASWKWYNRPPGARRSLIEWLKKRRLKPVLYRGLFAGHMVSRRVLERLSGMRLPYGFCEMRWPTIVTAMGFKCVRLNFPMVRYGIPVRRDDIIANREMGIFHPVYEDINIY